MCELVRGYKDYTVHVALPDDFGAKIYICQGDLPGNSLSNERSIMVPKPAQKQKELLVSKTISESEKKKRWRTGKNLVS